MAVWENPALMRRQGRLTLCLLLVLAACQGGPAARTPTAVFVSASSTPQPTPITLAALTGRIAYGSADSIGVMNADGSGKIQLTTAGPGETDYDPSWAPDGTQIAYLVNSSGLESVQYTLIVQDLPAGEPLQLGTFESEYQGQVFPVSKNSVYQLIDRDILAYQNICIMYPVFSKY